MHAKRYVVIMAGGRGERFWPQSRLRRPKHLLPIVGDQPMLTQTVVRLDGVVPPEQILIVTNAEQRDAVLEICPMLPPENIVAEPVGRDTAAVVGLAAILVGSRDPGAAFAMLPADHVIHDQAGFQSTVRAAFEAAEREDALVTIGIRAEYPATGYGYIQRGAPVSETAGRKVFAVKAFKEKPDAETARAYLESGEFYWNAGMFFWRVPIISAEFERQVPGLWEALRAILKGLDHGAPLSELLEKHYPGLERISVDYAIMENALAVRMIESAFDWDDVGEWPAVERHHVKDDQGNVRRGQVVIQNGHGNIVMNEGDHTTALIGVDDLIVVQTADATLVCAKDKAQEIKALVKSLAADSRYHHLL